MEEAKDNNKINKSIKLWSSSIIMQEKQKLKQ